MKIDQALFGYDGGHRLLAGSLSLGVDAPLLTELSDLASGVIFGGSNGYWTGVPLPSIKKYALLRTWSAPEMSRPGCVWTHALLLDPEVFELVNDLSDLQQFASRPKSIADIDRYKHSLELAVSPESIVSSENGFANRQIISNILSSTYTQREAIIRTASPEEIVGPLFSVWSQQWPRLRRNFKFQTALTRSPRGASSIRLDVTNVLASSTEPGNDESSSAHWVYAAEIDILEGGGGPLRRFLWVYGADVKKQKASFKPLVDISILHFNPTAEACMHVLRVISQAFPLEGDARKLKSDLVDGVLVGVAQPELIVEMLKGIEPYQLPMPSQVGLARLAGLWPDRPDQLVLVAQAAIESNAPLAEMIQNVLVQLEDSAQVWLAENSPYSVASFLCSHNPRLITSKSIRRMSDKSLIGILPLIMEKVDFSRVVDDIVSRESLSLASALFDLAPEATAAYVLERLSVANSVVARVWRSELFKRSSILLRKGVLEGAKSSDVLFECAGALDWISYNTLSASCDPWLSALGAINVSYPSKREEKLIAFLVVLALRSGGYSSMRMVEDLFEVLHSRIIRSELDVSVVEFISPYLASAGFFKSWDLGLRLRLSVVDAFVRFDWPVSVFLSLSGNKKVRRMLAEAASEVDGAMYYVDDSFL